MSSNVSVNQTPSGQSYTVCKHPVLKALLTRLRDSNTSPSSFRALLNDSSRILAYEATTDLELQTAKIQTVHSECDGAVLKDNIGIVPIMRAGLGMEEAFLAMLPDAEVWHLGLYRDSKTDRAIEYYNKLPQGCGLDLAIVIDPMLATGKTAIAAVDILKEWGVRRIKFVSLLAAQQGIINLLDAHPDLALYVGDVDATLSPEGLIIPGLGDAGDRQFKTQRRG
eukprot:TRINITY_DN14413_c0_g1_i1.p1 TRINITY_DN14413_c0_g1~~TRINITY_DN14413_c0_g1_i1.p1  ORF type:complete len:224 (+),score=44.58 TRINITY_DN14413_c0_g1_i1:111-782(+)